MSDEPLKITGIDVANIPRPDQHGLYSVTLLLNREPSAEWARDFPALWVRGVPEGRMTAGHPHPKATVSGSTIVLHLTTIEDVKAYHRPVVGKLLGQVDAQLAETKRRAVEAAALSQMEEDRADQELEAHRRHVREVVEGMDFD